MSTSLVKVFSFHNGWKFFFFFCYSGEKWRYERNTPLVFPPDSPSSIFYAVGAPRLIQKPLETCKFISAATFFIIFSLIIPLFLLFIIPCIFFLLLFLLRILLSRFSLFFFFFLQIMWSFWSQPETFPTSSSTVII